ncbi:hypothetical protein DFH28DRAFT_472591 [Melampsora americana]|nr:hypothetical protein DFH28DRAFT_472591 [Melampsora americana]
MNVFNPSHSQQSSSSTYSSSASSPQLHHHLNLNPSSQSNQTHSSSSQSAYHPTTTTRQASIKRPLPPVPPISSHHHSQQSQPTHQTQALNQPLHHYHHHPYPQHPNQFQQHPPPNQFQHLPSNQFQPQAPNQFHSQHSNQFHSQHSNQFQPQHPHFQQNPPHWSHHHPIRTPPSNHFSPPQAFTNLPLAPTNSISQASFEQTAQQYYPIKTPIQSNPIVPLTPLSRELSTKFNSSPFSPKRNLPTVPSSSPKPLPIINTHQTQDNSFNSIPHQNSRRSSLQGARPLLNREPHQISISNTSKPLPIPPSDSNLIQTHPESQSSITKPISPSTSSINPTTESINTATSSKPTAIVTPTVPVLNIVGIDEESEEESFNGSQPIITLDSTSESSSGPLPVPIIVTEEDESSTQSNGEISIPVPLIITAEDDETSTQSISKPNDLQTQFITSSNLTDSNSIQSLFCAGCDQIIAGRIVNALQKRWHPACFKCEHCEMDLEHVAFYEHQGKAYCGVDYDEFFSLKCHHCNTSITDESYVTLDEPSLLDGPRHYHQLHLFCAECGDPFLNPKSLEESSKISKRTSIQTQSTQEVHEKKLIEPNPFVLHKGYPYCEKCHLRLHKPKCFGCKSSMIGDIINAMGKQWHETCFVCKDCENRFWNGMFFVKDSNAFCEKCYSIQIKQTF